MTKPAQGFRPYLYVLLMIVLVAGIVWRDLHAFTFWRWVVLAALALGVAAVIVVVAAYRRRTAALLAEANRLASAGDRPAALAVYHQLSQRDPYNADYHLATGVLLGHLDARSEAVFALQEAANRGGNRADITLALADAYAALGDADNARKTLENGLRAARSHWLIRQDSPELSSIYAYFLIRLQRPAEALPILESARARRPADPQIEHLIQLARAATTTNQTSTPNNFEEP